MANLARYAPGIPLPAFDDLDEDVVVALAKRVEKLRKRDEDTLVALTEALVETMARTAGMRGG